MQDWSGVGVICSMPAGLVICCNGLGLVCVVEQVLSKARAACGSLTSQLCVLDLGSF